MNKGFLQVDQLFSILATSFQGEIDSIESLVSKIENSGILPPPKVEMLDFSWDWKQVAFNVMTKKQLKYHSNFHAFKLLKENDQVALRAKQFLFSKSWLPESGIKLLRDITVEEFPIAMAAPFRVEHLNFKQIFLDLAKYFQTMDLETRMRVQSSWEKLRKKIESLPNFKDSFERLGLSDLVKQRNADGIANVPENFAHLTDDVEQIPELEGEKFPEGLEEADFQSECVVGLDVCVYTQVKSQRPWVGRVASRASDNSFNISWYEKKSRSKTYTKSNLPADEIEDASVILWGFSSNRTDISFDIDPLYKVRISRLYDEHDSTFVD